MFTLLISEGKFQNIKKKKNWKKEPCTVWTEWLYMHWYTQILFTSWSGGTRGVRGHLCLRGFSLGVQASFHLRKRCVRWNVWMCARMVAAPVKRCPLPQLGPAPAKLWPMTGASGWRSNTLTIQKYKLSNLQHLWNKTVEIMKAVIDQYKGLISISIVLFHK